MSESPDPVEIAREGLRRLSAQRLATTPDNFRPPYQDIAGTAAAERFTTRVLGRLGATLTRSTPENVAIVRNMGAAIGHQGWSEIARSTMRK